MDKHTPTPWREENVKAKLIHQLRKTVHALSMRNDRTAYEDEAIRTANKAIAKAEGKSADICELCGADTMTVNCNNANCDTGKER